MHIYIYIYHISIIYIYIYTYTYAYKYHICVLSMVIYIYTYVYICIFNLGKTNGPFPIFPLQVKQAHSELEALHEWGSPVIQISGCGGFLREFHHEVYLEQTSGKMT